MMNDRDRAKAKLRKHRTEETWNEYKRLKNLVNHKVSYLKNSSFNNILRNKTNKDLWKELKSLNVHNKAQCNIENQFGDANVVNNHFLDSIPKATNAQRAAEYYQKYKICEAELRFSLVSLSDVAEALLTIRNTSAGSDGLSMSMIKMCCPYILHHLSGFRVGHSCTTALLHITDDIIQELENDKCTLLMMLDFSKAFDTINYQTLITVLKSCGLSAESLSLLNSYLLDRTQAVKLGCQVSESKPVSAGVPQGSVLGPLLFSIYTSQFVKFISHCQIHMYADDTQMYHSFSETDAGEAIKEINSDLKQISDIAKMHSLNINPKKSTALLFAKKTSRKSLADRINICIDGEPIHIFEQAKNLGLVVDQDLRFRAHISRKIQISYAALNLLYPHRKYLSVEIKKMLCDTLVLSQFNFCSPVFAPCLDKDSMRRIQRVQNSCIRYIYGIRKYDRVSHKLKDLDWLCMDSRFQLHALCLFHNLVTSKTPPYLYNKICFCSDVHTVDTRNKNLITAPCHKTKLFERSFKFNIYKLYNSIPSRAKCLSIAGFKEFVLNYLYSQQ
nr:unnamed protein product [Callosobruchus chinensis]